MRITKSAEFSIRVLIYLASQNGLARMPVLSETLDIPYNHLTKIIQALGKSHIVQTKQGKNGGVRLLKDPRVVSLKMVIDLMDGPIRLSDCLQSNELCRLTEQCKLKNVLFGIQNKIDHLLEETSIADILHKE